MAFFFIPSFYHFLFSCIENDEESRRTEFRVNITLDIIPIEPFEFQRVSRGSRTR